MSSFEVGDILTADALNLVADQPVCKLVAASTQSIPHNTVTIITYVNGEDMDATGMHDNVTNPGRITPNVAGVYEVSCTLMVGGRADWTWVQTGIRKNGTAIAPHNRIGPNTNNTVRAVEVASVEVECNGSTDYLEQTAQHVNGASAAQDTNQSSQFSSRFSARRIRPLIS
jgi:hypothetical protein